MAPAPAPIVASAGALPKGSVANGSTSGAPTEPESFFTAGEEPKIVAPPPLPWGGLFLGEGPLEEPFCQKKFQKEEQELEKPLLRGARAEVLPNWSLYDDARDATGKT